MIPFVAGSAGWLLTMLILAQAGPVGRSPAQFALCYMLGFGAMALMVRSCPREWPWLKTVCAVVVLGGLGRLGFWEFPVGNDVYRYIWEGYIQIHGFNPYQVAPDSPQVAYLAAGELSTVWQQINHRGLTAGYPPLAMLLFQALASISPTTGLFKSAMLGFDLLILIMLIMIARLRQVPPANLFWYAANPLVLVYIAGEAHLDSIQAAFIVIGFYGLLSRKPILGFLSFGLATASKYFAAVVFPFVMQRSNRHAWPAALLFGVCFIPFADDLYAIFHSLLIFGGQMHYNDGLADILRVLFGRATLPILTVIFVGLMVMIFLVEHDPLRSGYLAIGTLLLCLPTLHPWYLVIIAPFMVFFPSRAWLTLMLATVATLPVLTIEYRTGIFQEIRWLKLIEYIPFYGLLVYDTLRRRKGLLQPTFKTARSVSVVMPVLNESDRILETIGAIGTPSGLTEIIVVDGGSDDETIDRARRTAATVIASPRGRGRQVRAGADLASGDVVLVLHADTTLNPNAVENMLQALEAYPHIAGGAFQMRFAKRSMHLDLVAGLNNFRARWFGIAFGDQAQFIRRDAIEHMGGLPDLPLMEDVELSMRLKRFGRPLFVRRGVHVSERRWERRGFSGNAWLVLRLFVQYLVERRVSGSDGIRTDYYRKYYGRV